MSQPAGYNNEPVNPDSRLLPQGWVQQYDPNYKTWFYVNTNEQPPRSSWVHPLGALAPPPGPPPGASPNRDPAYGGGGWNQGPPQQYNSASGYGSPPPGGWNNSPPPQSSYGGYGYNGPPQGNYGSGYPPQEQRGWFGGGGHQQPPQYVQAPPKKSGPGMGTALLAGGAGLVGGALLMDAIEDHDRNEYDQGYNQGFDQGNDQGQDNNYDDNGGGDFF